MNFWDSVHRGLEKASNEAGRIAKGQRLRSSIDKLGRQVHECETVLLHRVMQLFNTGALTQTELLPLCQELVQIQQQLEQIQIELQQMNMQQQIAPAVNNHYGAQTGSGEFSTVPPSQIAPTVFSPYAQSTGGNPYGDGFNQLPPNHPYADTPVSAPPPPPGMSDNSALMPPPPPGVLDPTISAQPTSLVSAETSGVFALPDATISSQPTALVARDMSVTVCSQCGEPALHPGAFCQNCGSPLTPSGTDARNRPEISASTSGNIEEKNS